MLHAYYRKTKVEYRQFQHIPGMRRRRFLRTKFGAIRHWSLEECLDATECPLEPALKQNLKFLIGLRHEIEHQMTRRIDDHVSAKFQAAALNFNSCITTVWEQVLARRGTGIQHSVRRHLGVHCQRTPGRSRSSGTHSIFYCAI